VAWELGLIPELTAELAYARRPDPRYLTQRLEHYLLPIPVADAGPADVLRMSWGGEATHVGLYTGVTLIHAYAGARRCVEHRMDEQWWRRVRAAYRWPGLTWQS